MSRIFSAVQPTGNLHLGNYLGALRHWVTLQQKHDDILYCIVDLHAITVPQDPTALTKSIRETTAAYIACGLDPKQSILFHQSFVKEHAELAWILGTMVPIGWLNRMTQFKEKAGKNKEKSGLGLYSYPVLMAADILLYQADLVPVGEDQKQHIELTRDIAGAFNRRYEKEFFTLPEPMIAGKATRVMSLRDGKNKMSKSDASQQSRIHLFDDPDTITQKLKKAKTDSQTEITYDPEDRPELANLINIYSELTGSTPQKVTEEFSPLGFAEVKQRLADCLIEHLAPIQKRFSDIKSEQSYIDEVLRDGGMRAREIAEKTMGEVKEIVGLLQLDR